MTTEARPFIPLNSEQSGWPMALIGSLAQCMAMPLGALHGMPWRASRRKEVPT